MKNYFILQKKINNTTKTFNKNLFKLHRIHTTKYIPYCFSIIFWICLWQFLAFLIANELFLPSPISVWNELTDRLIFDEAFKNSIVNSLLHISEGFLIGFFSGIILAVISALSEAVRILLWFPIKLIKTVPVASFVILALLWADSSKLSIIIPFLMVLPTLYINTLNGIKLVDKKMLEMAKIFKISPIKKIRYIYIPQVLPHISSSVSISIGMAWKSGIAAEIIGLSQGTIGNRLYQAKIYLNTSEMFAWTIVTVILCIICEWIINKIMYLLEKFI